MVDTVAARSTPIPALSTASSTSPSIWGHRWISASTVGWSSFTTNTQASPQTMENRRQM